MSFKSINDKIESYKNEVKASLNETLNSEIDELNKLLADRISLLKETIHSQIENQVDSYFKVIGTDVIQLRDEFTKSFSNLTQSLSGNDENSDIDNQMEDNSDSSVALESSVTENKTEIDDSGTSQVTVMKKAELQKQIADLQKQIDDLNEMSFNSQNDITADSDFINESGESSEDLSDPVQPEKITSDEDESSDENADDSEDEA